MATTDDAVREPPSEDSAAAPSAGGADGSQHDRNQPPDDSETDLVLDPDVARTLLKELSDAQDKVDALRKKAGQLDEPLRLGNNWPAGVLATEMRQAAVGVDAAFTPALEKFAHDLERFAAAVRRSINRTVEADDVTADSLRDIDATVERA